MKSYLFYWPIRRKYETPVSTSTVIYLWYVYLLVSTVSAMIQQSTLCTATKCNLLLISAFVASGWKSFNLI